MTVANELLRCGRVATMFVKRAGMATSMAPVADKTRAAFQHSPEESAQKKIKKNMTVAVQSCDAPTCTTKSCMQLAPQGQMLVHGNNMVVQLINGLRGRASMLSSRAPTSC